MGKIAKSKIEYNELCKNIKKTWNKKYKAITTEKYKVILIGIRVWGVQKEILRGKQLWQPLLEIKEI